MTFDEWFTAMWSKLIGFSSTPEIAQFKNALYLALKEREESL